MSALAKMRALLLREAPAQAPRAEEALRRAARSDAEHSMIGAVDDYAMPAAIVSGTRFEVTPSVVSARRARQLGSPILDFHTHPSGYSVAPSGDDFDYWAARYAGVPSKLRTLVAAPPSFEQRARSGYHFFEAADPTTVFNSKKLADARFDTQRAAARGSFGQVVRDDPVFADYFDYGGDLSDFIEDNISVAYLTRQAEKGLGRQEFRLGGRRLTPSYEATPQRMYDLLGPELVEFLRSRKYASGGPV